MAQLVEQLIRNQQVAGSSPASSSNPQSFVYQGLAGFFFARKSVRERAKIRALVFMGFKTALLDMRARVGVGNALKSRFSAFLPQKVRRRQRLTISDNQNGATAAAAPFLIFNRTAGNLKFILS